MPSKCIAYRRVLYIRPAPLIISWRRKRETQRLLHSFIANFVTFQNHLWIQQGHDDMIPIVSNMFEYRLSYSFQPENFSIPMGIILQLYFPVSWLRSVRSSSSSSSSSSLVVENQVHFFSSIRFRAKIHSYPSLSQPRHARIFYQVHF